MTEEKKVQYFNIVLCKAGMLLVGLGLIRAASIHQDRLSFLLGFIGYSLFSLHIRALEKKWGIPKKYVWISNGIFILLLVPLAYLLAFPSR
ncbi:MULTISPECIES: hypothetical protein [unclassified Planococcus (in: firmicutes)]|uniref:hypothetical protein n=1 Tax=unclassified Planococcus (in: firmicutes) TaxID=2662419 RepID=UPI000C3389E2|nr:MULTISPECIES: hypothetical protein [unclassified Planococcus (in: firmicutes)]AUD14974.1 hypothetical protein CW734_16505 [Planococcus sp. MB-3u-03]PKG47087.1 hypothetical protein CXF66_04615 [Planococcus sp. Urea-trap-24]PKG87784.1 hypothetical protein CXF91_17595 [Planococcus sp. Urea-3u-39]PKH35442.1 hypothetical protein CXF77_17275 [Planococcus sp. MB-3u-09]